MLYTDTSHQNYTQFLSSPQRERERERKRERERERERERDHVINFFFQFDIRSFKVTLGQSLWSMAMCLVWQSVLFGNV